MKTILIVRHAKSDWDNLSQSDFERELNERGKTNAPEMGKRLKNRNFSPDYIISSSAVRAKQTCILIAEQLTFDIQSIELTNTLYHASIFGIQDHIISLDNQYNTVMMVCHNPGITHFINATIGIITHNIPTCGMASIKIDCDNWLDFEKAKKELDFYDFPKNK